MTAASRRPVWLFVTALLASLGVMVIWGASSPIGSSPDEQIHLWSIWCANGTSTSDCTMASAAGQLTAPTAIVFAGCHAHDSSKSGACTRLDPGASPPRADFQADLSNSVSGAYPNTYYEIAGIFAGPDVHSSAAVIRILNGFLCVGLVFAVIGLADWRVGRAVAISWLVCVVPLGLFILPSVSPSSWAVTGAGLSWAAAFGAAEAASLRRRAALAGIAALCVLVAFAARTDAAAFALVGVFVGLFLSPGARQAVRAHWRAALVAGAVVVAGALAYMSSMGQWDLMTRPLTEASDDFSLLFSNLTELPQLWTGSLGTWGLGQLDTALPSAVSVLAIFATAGVVFWGLGEMWRAKAVAVASLLALLLLVPLLILQGEAAPVGQWVQPRYLLPLLITFVGLVLLSRTPKERGLSRAQAIVLASAVTVAACLAHHRLLRRYTSGTDVTSPNLNDGAEWWHGTFPSPMITWALGAILFGVVAATAVLAARGPGPPRLRP